MSFGLAAHRVALLLQRSALPRSGVRDVRAGWFLSEVLRLATEILRVSIGSRQTLKHPVTAGHPLAAILQAAMPKKNLGAPPTRCSERRSLAT